MAPVCYSRHDVRAGKMRPMRTLFKAAAVWLVVIGVETVHGVLRTGSRCAKAGGLQGSAVLA